jgi:hypothetical protein
MQSRTVILGLVTLTMTGMLAAGQPVRHDSGEVVPVVVTNFPDLVRVEGSVAIEGPIRTTSLATIADMVVPPVRREDANHLVDAGSIVADGFAAVVLSLTGEIKGQPRQPGEVGAILLPDEDRVLRAFTERGQFLMPLEVKALPSTGGSPYFAAQTRRFTVAYPRYRVFLYNAGDRSVGVSLHAYLTD